MSGVVELVDERCVLCCCEILWLCRFMVVFVERIFFRHAKLYVDKLFDAGAPGL